MSLEGKVVAITGASAGIGRATARELARRGADVGLIARGEDRLRPPPRGAPGAGGARCVAPADVADAEQVERAAARDRGRARADRRMGQQRDDGRARRRSWTRTPEEFQRVTEVTYLGSSTATQAALRRMLPRDRGTIVQVGSALSRRGIPLQATYCGAKHAVKGFLDSLRGELHPSTARTSTWRSSSSPG